MSRHTHARLDHAYKDGTPAPMNDLARDFLLASTPNTADQLRKAGLRCAEHANGDRKVLVELLEEIGLL